MATTIYHLEPYFSDIENNPNPNRASYFSPLRIMQEYLENQPPRAQITATSGTQVNFAATDLAGRPMWIGEDTRIAKIDSTISAVTVSGGAGTQYIYADIGASAVTLVSIATAPAVEGTQYRIPLGEIVWNGAVITSLISYAGEIAVNLQPPITGEHRNLMVRQDTTLPDSKVLITADALDIEGNRVTSISVTADLAVAGLNGLDTGAEASNTFYWTWVIRNPTSGAVAGLFSASDTAPTLPSGYTQKRLVSFRRNNASSNLIRAHQAGDLWMGNAPDMVVANAITASADLDTSSFVPEAAAQMVLLNWQVSSGASSVWAIDDKNDSTIRYVTLDLGTGGAGHAWVRKNSINIVRATEVSGDRTFTAHVAGCKVRFL